jgi:hypothetical protein
MDNTATEDTVHALIFTFFMTDNHLGMSLEINYIGKWLRR